MNFAQTVDPYKVWGRFPKPNIKSQVFKFHKVRTEVMQLLAAREGMTQRELSLCTGRARRATHDMLRKLRLSGWVKRIGQRYYVTQRPISHVNQDDNE